MNSAAAKGEVAEVPGLPVEGNPDTNEAGSSLSHVGDISFFDADEFLVDGYLLASTGDLGSCLSVNPRELEVVPV